MPYVARGTRSYLAPKMESLLQAVRQSSFDVGDLNYVITTLLDTWVHSRRSFGYVPINAVIGVLECAKQEFYRRVAIPYEEKKRGENGDVY